MRYRDFRRSLRCPFPSSKLMDCVENVRTVVTIPAGVADSDHDILQDDESVPVLEALHRDLLGMDDTRAVLASKIVHRFQGYRIPPPLSASGSLAWHAKPSREGRGPAL